MASPASLGEFGGQKFDSMSSGESGGSASSSEMNSALNSAAALGSDQQGGQASNGHAEGAGGGEGGGEQQVRSLSDLGLGEGEGNQDGEGGGQSQGGDGGQQGSAAPLELSVEGSTVIGTVDGNPITAAELKNGYMRHADYTRKTTEIADYRKNAEPALQYIAANMEPLKALDLASQLKERGDSEGAIRELRTAFGLVAKQLGIENASFDDAKGRSRDAGGRFTSEGAPESNALLEKLKDEFGEESVQYQQALQIDALQKQIEAGNQRWNQFQTGLDQSRARAESRAELDRMHGVWQSKGVAAIDIDKAMSLVGQPISAEMAMQLAGFNQIQDWLRSGKAAEKRPDEPRNLRPGGIIADGKSLTDYARERLR